MQRMFFNLFSVGLSFQINFFPAYWYQHYKGEQEVGAHCTREVGKDSILKKKKCNKKHGFSIHV